MPEVDCLHPFKLKPMSDATCERAMSLIGHRSILPTQEGTPFATFWRALCASLYLHLLEGQMALQMVTRQLLFKSLRWVVSSPWIAFAHSERKKHLVTACAGLFPLPFLNVAAALLQ